MRKFIAVLFKPEKSRLEEIRVEYTGCRCLTSSKVDIRPIHYRFKRLDW
jgi:hypothetical protein